MNFNSVTVGFVGTFSIGGWWFYFATKLLRCVTWLLWRPKDEGKIQVYLQSNTRFFKSLCQLKTRIDSNSRKVLWSFLGSQIWLQIINYTNFYEQSIIILSNSVFQTEAMSYDNNIGLPIKLSNCMKSFIPYFVHYFRVNFPIIQWIEEI